MNVYILEDNVQQLAHLTSTIQEIAKELHITPITISAFQATDQLKLALPPASEKNIFILDLEINGYPKAGLDFSELIRKDDQLATIIFITTHDEFVLRTYKSRARALDFIAKDHEESIFNELKKDLAYIKDKLSETQKEFFTYKSYFKTFKIPLDQICFFESNPENTHSSLMHTIDNKEIQLTYNLRELTKMNRHFYRAHRRYLINLQLIQNVDMLNNKVIFRNHTTCPVSRRRGTEILKLINR